MKLYSLAHVMRLLTTACLTLVIIAGSSAAILAAPATKGRAAEISVSGSSENGEKPFLKLNGEQVLSGRTFFSYSTLETPQNVSADINLPGLGRVTLSPGTMLSLGFSENSITGRLHAGMIRVSSTEGTKVEIETPDDRVMNNPATAGTFSVDLTSGVSKTVAETGDVTTNTGKAVPQVQTTASAPSIWIPVTVFGVIVGTAVTAIIIDRSDDDNTADAIVSPLR